MFKRKNVLGILNHMDFAIGGASGLLEVLVTHPFDSYKTHAQVKTSVPWRPFAGVVPRLVGVVPMRVLFWGTLGSMKEYHPLLAGAATGTLQTLVDAPIENKKISTIMQTTFKPYRGMLPHCARNVGFACAVAATFPLGYGPLGAMVGTTLTHPFDTLKTAEQSGLPRRALWSGLVPRTAQAVVAISVGQAVHYIARHFA